jgi:RNA polymerase I-specific transcription initiation factor RRN3
MSIVEEFSKLTHHLNIMYCYPLINPSAMSSNLELILPQHSELCIPARIDAYYPFDPLPMPKCKLIVEHIFQEWEGNDDEISDHEPTESDISNSIQGMSLDERNLSFSTGMSIGRS